MQIYELYSFSTLKITTNKKIFVVIIEHFNIITNQKRK